MKPAVGVLVGVCVSVVLGLLFALIAGRLTPTISFFALSGGALVGWMAASRTSTPAIPAGQSRIGVWGWFVIVIFALFALRVFCWVLFNYNQELRVLSPNNLGDLSLHLTYIQHFAKGGEFWPDNPIYAREKLHYPLGIDLFNALFTSLGADVRRGLIWTGLTGAALTCFMLWRWGGAFTIAGFLFNGGVAGFAAFKLFTLTNLTTLRFGIFKELKLQDYQAELAWKSIPLSIFVTQRGFLYALPAGLLLLYAWKRRFHDKAAPLLPLWVELLLYATMPIFHLHTFLFLSVLLGFWLAFCFVETRTGGQFLKFIGFALVPASALVILQTEFFRASSGMHWMPGWMQGEQNFIWFWFNNFGILPLLVIMLCVFLWKHPEASPDEQRCARMFVIPSVLLFFAACFVMLSKWEWDNTKLMIWCYLAVLPFLWQLLLEKRHFVLRAAACFALFFSGFVSLLGGIDQKHTGYPIANRRELDGLAALSKAIPINETVAAFPTFNHPLLLHGHKVVAGYSGHLWSHGINPEEDLAKLKLLLLGAPDWQEIARSLGVRYLFWGLREQEAYAASRKPWALQSRLVMHTQFGDLYDLETSSD